MAHVYILELENGKYYIGRTDVMNIYNRFYSPRIESHYAGTANCSWTNIYKPIGHIIIPNCGNFGELVNTLEYMSEFGIQNVRGDAFCQYKLDNDTIIFLQKMINNATNKCFNCNESGHYAKNCPYCNK